jgi:hypothetical protein
MIASNIQLSFIADNLPEKYQEVSEIYNEYFYDYQAFDLGRSLGLVYSVKDFNLAQLKVFRIIDSIRNKK